MPFLTRPRPSQAEISQDTASQRPPARKTQASSHSNIDLTFTLRNGMAQQEVSLMAAFGKESFRGCQRQVIEAALDGNDVFLIAPTGLGKSLCYQLPALVVKHGLSLVVSPLLALMQNQVSYLQSLNLPAATLNSTLPSTEREAIYQDLNCGHPRTRLLYIAPELASKASFRKTLQKIYRNGELSRFVIDEGHCISEWGHDFRKDYRSLSYFRLDFPNVPIMVLTATATDRVRGDILKLLRLSPPRLKTFVMSFNRPNLHYEVQYKSANDDPYPAILKLIRQFNSWREDRYIREGKETCMHPVCGIVYSPRRNQCDTIAARLNADGINAAAYHAGMDAKDRERILDAWVDGKRIGVVVATVAFGMGVDRADVRFVIHYEIPKSIEAYYQESGRAGRDRRPARCILFYSREDVERTKYLITQAEARRDAEGVRLSQRPAGMSNFEAMVNYCEDTSKCRHKTLCEYFGDTIDEAENRVGGASTFCDFACDVCRDPEGTCKQKLEKLTPLVPQDAVYPPNNHVQEVEMDIFGANINNSADTTEATTTRESPQVNSDDNVAPNDAPENASILENYGSYRKEAGGSDGSAPLSKRREHATMQISDEKREKTVQSLLDILSALPIQDDVPDLFNCTARRLEGDLFNRVSKDRPINALGRSSTLLTAGRKHDTSDKYIKEKNRLLAKVKTFIETATRNDVELEEVQQGEIWETIRQVLDGDV